ncbi:hypothetical protein MLD38_002121 [Melastoma candidum]|uniref:Uncharacterized protein n=1 Tax=Melastoma candidum TaxID=119954 RepID=A0ACB9SJG2_9MYRT|nr:hypothetical protein MLD38_002121 [Melastoma candidum]
MEGLVVSEAKLAVNVQPSMGNRVPRAVLDELGSHLFRYSHVFGGVLLAYDVRIVGNNASVLGDIHPYPGVQLTGNLLLFSPRMNMLLEGTVAKLTSESIHLVVLGFASAVVVDGDIREEFEYLTKRDEEVYQSKYYKHHVIKVGTIIRFRVKSFDEETIHISGSLTGAGTGSVKWLDVGEKK